MADDFRIGLIVPSSNVTMETEIPAMLQSRPDHYAEQFTFHSSRMRMQSVTQEELERMDEQSLDCATLLSDARCDVLAYACLIGIMAQGPGYHEESEAALHQQTVENDADAPVVTSAGALVRAMDRLDAENIVLIAPYMTELTETMIEYFESTGVSVIDYKTLECPDNLEVAQLDQRNLLNIAADLDTDAADALVLSSCVQMPSLASIQAAEDKYGLPVFSAAAATTYEILDHLNLSTQVAGAGRLLSGQIN
ncbi:MULTISPECIES: maleate cis-trans isomerase family protein [Halorubrum]|uniref:maleate cis-trans isomerase family protein n=1 Tax=Halorubrum TaxID=56688 RepID=UPI00097F87EB|nr:MULTISPECIES: aspartate/glutamate racemase family protein [Halorubrum]MDB2238984.1 aspartate/glutamate racemase family protein [Halorubrum ezzemoulense]MDB2249721.1 aspartate/glutamate racemase family protein [Halorubrum ezzemoulense]